MQKPNHTVVSVTNEYPSGLKTAQEIAGLIQGLAQERILELAVSGYLPHYLIDGSVYLFKPAEVKSWVAENLMVRSKGSPISQAIRLTVQAPPPTERPPSAIQNINNLQQIPAKEYQPGIYFLCLENEVIYVGQSVGPAARIRSHVSSKDFDRVYLLPVPESELNEVEGAFIKHLRPKQQGGIKSGAKEPIAPKTNNPIHCTIANYCSA